MSIITTPGPNHLNEQNDHNDQNNTTKEVIPMSASKKRRQSNYPDLRKRLRSLMALVGFLSLIWFLVRVIPKPSRAAYPCMRTVFPMASAFVVWIIGLGSSAFLIRKGRRHVHQSRYAAAAICGIIAIAMAWYSLSGNGIPMINKGMLPVLRAEMPPDPVNEHIGEPKGYKPGRVAWVHDPDATNWGGPESGESCWEPQNTSQLIVDSMMSRAIRRLAGKGTDTGAWDALFRYINIQKGEGDRGYQQGEKIVIKINLTDCNAAWGYDPSTRDRTRYLDQTGDTNPQIVLSLLRQLTDVLSVTQSDIYVGDMVSFFPNQWYDLLEPEFPRVNYLDHYAFPGRTAVQKSTIPFYWSTSDAAGKLQDYLPVAFVEADYIINVPVLKSHSYGGITVCAKNHYGSLVRGPLGHEWGEIKDYYDLHPNLPCFKPGRGYYRTLVDLMGHAHIGGKTVLYLIDALYAGQGWNGVPFKWNMMPFNGDWPSSLFASQDPVAIDSVAYDFLYAEWPDKVENGNCGSNDVSLEGGAQDYLHEAALANDPPSGTVYDPENDGIALESLGVHEHWNNPTDKQYSRNLGTGNGIELISSDQLTCEGNFDEDGDVDGSDLHKLVSGEQSMDLLDQVAGEFGRNDCR